MKLMLLGLPGGGEWLLIIAVVLLLFGASAIPKLARSLGRAQGEFQKARKDFQKDLEAGRKEAAQDEDEPSPPEAVDEPHVPRAP